MKRIKSACILQTVIFFQKPELGYNKEQSHKINREDFERYKSSLDRSRSKYVIVDEAVQDDGSIIVHIKKQYNERIDVSEYFD